MYVQLNIEALLLFASWKLFRLLNNLIQYCYTFIFVYIFSILCNAIYSGTVCFLYFFIELLCIYLC